MRRFERDQRLARVRANVTNGYVANGEADQAVVANNRVADSESDGPVEGYLPGHVLTGKDLNRLLDILDLAHFAGITPGNRVTYSQIARIHPMKAHPDNRQGRSFANYSNYLTRLLSFAKEVGGLDIRKCQDRCDLPIYLWLPSPEAVKARANELLEELEILDEERSPRKAAKRRVEDEGPFTVEIPPTEGVRDPERESESLADEGPLDFDMEEWRSEPDPMSCDEPVYFPNTSKGKR